MAKSGMLAEAKTHLEKAKKLGMDEASMNYVNAEIESAKANLEDSVSLLKRIISNKTNKDIYNRALLLAAKNYIDLENYEDALSIYLAIFNFVVDTYQVGENLAYLYTKNGYF